MGSEWLEPARFTSDVQTVDQNSQAGEKGEKSEAIDSNCDRKERNNHHEINHGETFPFPNSN